MDFLTIVWDALSIVVRGFPVVLTLIGPALIPAMLIGLICGIAASSRVKPLRWLVMIYVYLFRSTPFLMLIFIAYYGLPHYGIKVSATVTAITALAVCHGAYITEIVRGGLLGFDKGQSEAAKALGFTNFQCLRDIVVPQTLISVIPSLLGQSIHMVKDTALVSVIGISELTKLGKDVVIRTNSPFIVLPVVAAAYFILCYVLQFAAKRLEAYGRTRVG